MKTTNFILTLFLSICFCTCSVNPENEYFKYNIEVEGEDDSTFDCLGETRTLLVRALRHTLDNGKVTNSIEYINPRVIQITLEGSQFILDRVTDSTLVLTAKENLSNDVREGKLLMRFTDSTTNLTAGRLINLRQDPVGTNAPFRIITNNPPTAFPKEGGEVVIPFVCQKHIIGNSSAINRWEDASLVGLCYKYGTNVHHDFKVEKRGTIVGEYVLKVTAKPYYFSKTDTELISYFGIANKEAGYVYFRIDFTQEQDSSIADLPVEHMKEMAGVFTE